MEGFDNDKYSIQLRKRNLPNINSIELDNNQNNSTCNLPSGNIIIYNKITTLNKISFEIEYKTYPGEKIGITGNIDKLGNWDKNKCYKLKCFNEKIRKGSIDYNNNYKNFEFKFALLSNNNIIKYQEGENNYFEITNLKKRKRKI